MPEEDTVKSGAVIHEAPRLVLAPLRGVTHLTFRRCLAKHFGGFDCALSPFLTTIAGDKIKATHLKDIMPSDNDILPLTPQIIGKSPSEFRTLLTAVRDIGYRRCDLNVGCPWPMIIKKNRGAGLLRDADNLRRMLDVGCGVMGSGFSVKTRLGIDSADLLLKRMELFNEYPLAELTIHARTAKQRYGGAVDLKAFGECLKVAKMPIVYNGDIFSVEDFKRLRTNFPSVSGWMIGRGVVRDPSLAARIRGYRHDHIVARMRDFILDYSAQTRAELCGPGAFLGRMKELWSYHCDFYRDGAKFRQTILRVSQYTQYDAVLNEFYRAADGGDF